VCNVYQLQSNGIIETPIVVINGMKIKWNEIMNGVNMKLN
jgi:hypothetical protein